MANLSLRAKSLLGLVLSCLLVLIPAALVGWQSLESLRSHFGQNYANNLTQLNRQKILAPISRELALSLRLADSGTTQAWLADEDDPAKRAAFFREAEGYRKALLDRAYFIATRQGTYFYFNDDSQLQSMVPRYRLDRNKADDAWFFQTMSSPADYNVNVDINSTLKITRIWINVVSRRDGEALGVAGASMDLSGFLNDFTGEQQPGVTPMIVDARGAIQVHPDASAIAYNSGATGVDGGHSLFNQIPPDEHPALREAMHEAQTSPDHAAHVWLHLGNTRQYVSLAYIDELKWFVLTAVDLRAARVLDTGGWLWPALGGLALLIAALLLVFGYAIDRLVVRPIHRLQYSARAMADGRYDVTLPAGSTDEIGDLSRAFGVMAAKVRAHTDELETRVQQRTTELEEANRAMVMAHKKIDDSIDYASLIQRAILPDRQLTQSLGPQHFVLWRPRDVVGGDFYVFRDDGDNCLLGLMDCAGHGVPGALMTMLARAAIDLGIDESGPSDPAAVLTRADAAIRAMLNDAQMPRALATNTDAGLVYIDRDRKQLIYAGARISLYVSDGQDVREIRGGRRALGDKRMGEYENVVLPLASGTTFYLVTDGFLDQAGGEHGYGFGSQRFEAMLREHASRSLSDQAAAFTQELAEYQGARPQRDDITVLSFRFDQP